MCSATSNTFVRVVDTVDFWRTNAGKLEAPPISPHSLRRNRLSKFRDDSKHLSPLFTVLSFSYKVKYIEHNLVNSCKTCSQNKMRKIYKEHKGPIVKAVCFRFDQAEMKPNYRSTCLLSTLYLTMRLPCAQWQEQLFAFIICLLLFVSLMSCHPLLYGQRPVSRGDKSA